ncbi:MAG: hypothetical protein IJR91_07210 [Ruminococcus sp.]|nr:hypothetical protein [Ruminococcus sp.]
MRYLGLVKWLRLKAVDTLNELFMTVMDMVIKLSPIGVFCLITPVIAFRRKNS